MSESKAATATIRASIHDGEANGQSRSRRPVQGHAQDRRSQPRLTNIYINVATIDKKDKLVNEKVVDLMNVGTTQWLMKHMVWAYANGYRVETNDASPEQVAEYVKRGAEALQARFAG